MRRVIALTVALLAGCTAHTGAPIPGFSETFYNRTQVPVFVGVVVQPCSSATVTFRSLLAAGGATPPPGVATAGTWDAQIPTGYAGLVSVVVTSTGKPQATLGPIGTASLPPCTGQPWHG